MSLPETVAPALTAVPLSELQSSYPTSELLSRPVLNRAGEKVGRIEDLLMKDDHLAFAIVEVGDFVGAPGRRVIVAFEDLSIVDKEFVIPDATPDSIADLTVYDRGYASSDGLLLPRPRHGVKSAGHLVATTGGEPVPGLLTDITDGRRR